MFSQTGQKKIIAIGFQQALEILSNQPEVGAPPAFNYLADHQFLGNDASTGPANPGPGNWLDVNGTLTAAGQKMILDATNDIGYFDDAITRIPGRLLVAGVDAAAEANFNTVNFGFDEAKTAYPDRNGIQLSASSIYNAIVEGNFVNIGSFSGLTALRLIAVLRNSGAYLYAYNGTNWQLLYILNLDNTSSLFAGISGGTNAPSANVDYIRIPDTLSENLDTAQAYDDFSSPTTVAADSGSNGLNGTYSNVGLGGSAGGYFNPNKSSNVDIFSPAFASAFDETEGGFIIRAKLKNTDLWTDGSLSYFLYLWTDASNYIFMEKNSSDNQLRCRYRAGALNKTINFSPTSAIDFFGYGFRYSVLNDVINNYYNGTKGTSSAAALGTWSGTLTAAKLGSNNAASSEFFSGWIKDVIITLNGVLPTDVQMQWYTDTSNVITAAQLDTDFGAGNWVWWKLDEQHQSLATGPESQSLTQYAHNGQTPRIASGNMSVSPVLGPELDSGTLTVGKWYKITATQVDHFYTGCAINDTFKATAATALNANNKVQQIDIDTSVALLNYNDTNTWVSIDPTVTARTQAGLILRASSLTGLDTASYLHVYCDLIDNLIYVDQVTAGTVTPVTNNAFTYSAGARLIAWLSGTTLRVYYNETFLFETTVANTGNTIHGAFATDENTQWGEIQVTPVVNTTLAAQFDQYIP